MFLFYHSKPTWNHWWYRNAITSKSINLSIFTKYIDFQNNLYHFSFGSKVKVKFTLQWGCQDSSPFRAPQATPDQLGLLFFCLPSTLFSSSRFFHLHGSPCPPMNWGHTALHEQPHQPQHLGLVKSFADELKLIFHLILEVIRFKLVTFSGHETPGMFYSLSVLIFETNTCNPFQGRETSMKFQPTLHRFFVSFLGPGIPAVAWFIPATWWPI